MSKIIECYLDDFVSVDQDYNGQVFYHDDEKVKIVNPDHENYQFIGRYKGYKRKNYPGQDIYFIQLEEGVR